MAQFDREKIDLFLGVVRKYMQMRGPMTQKELAEATGTGVSTMSRFLNQQTRELNPQLIANITAILQIPLHEMIDFVEENYTEQFIRLVKFYKGDEPALNHPSAEQQAAAPAGVPGGGSERTTTAQVNVGGKSHTFAYQAETPPSGPVGEDSFMERINRLSFKQKGFLNDFLSLDADGRDLVADVGRNIISYLRQKGIDL